MIEVQDTIVSLDLFTEYFCCDIDKCKGACCLEGDAGAPVLEEEIAVLEDAAEQVWEKLTPEARNIIDSQGVVYPDPTGELVTSIIDRYPNGESAVSCPCVFAQTDEKGCYYCTIQSCKPISCSLYPVRLSKVGDKIAVNYHRWKVCSSARRLGEEKGIRVYQFLKEPLIRRFGESWYQEIELIASELKKQNISGLSPALS